MVQYGVYFTVCEIVGFIKLKIRKEVYEKNVYFWEKGLSVFRDLEMI